jgi:hypothetical protein
MLRDEIAERLGHGGVGVRPDAADGGEVQKGRGVVLAGESAADGANTSASQDEAACAEMRAVLGIPDLGLLERHHDVGFRLAQPCEGGAEPRRKPKSTLQHPCASHSCGKYCGAVLCLTLSYGLGRFVQKGRLLAGHRALARLHD